MPVYKVELYVEQCVRSILDQTFRDFELIIVDDATPDRSIEICQRFVEVDPRVKIIRHRFNQGVGAARNTGIIQARGKYIYFMDSDDELLPNAFEVLHRAAEETGADVVHSTSFINRYESEPGVFKEQTDIAIDPKALRGFIPKDQAFRVSAFAAPFMHVVPWLNLNRRDFLERIKFRFSPRMLADDTAYTLALMLFAEKYYCIPDRFYLYNIRVGSISTDKSFGKISHAVESLTEADDYFNSLIDRLPPNFISPDIKRAYLISLFNHLIGFHILRRLEPNELRSAQTLELFSKALRPYFAEGAGLAALFLQSYCDQLKTNLSTRQELFRLQQEKDRFRDEVRSGFLVTTQRKKLWSTQLELIEEFARICQKHDLKWFADSGTLIGAARHRGFIPWDDDVDLAMLRPDYEKFKRIAPTELNPNYSLDLWYDYNFEGDPGPLEPNLPTISREQLNRFPYGWPNGMYAKLRDNRTTMLEFYERKQINQGIWIDIFPYDPVPPFNDPKRDVLFAAERELLNLVNYPEQFIEAMKQKKPLTLSYATVEKLLTMSRKRRGEILEDYLARNWFESERVWYFNNFVRGENKSFELKWFRETVELPFERITLPAPIDYDQVLTAQYGDWRKLVVSRPHVLVSSRDVSYKDYFKSVLVPFV